MKRKPKGPKYRNLYARGRGGVIYYERVIGRSAEGKPVRKKLSTKTSDWDVAASFRDLYEQKKGIGTVAFYAGDIPKFGEFAERYLKEATSHLAPTTYEDREGMLRQEGPLVLHFGRMALDDIGRRELMEWWHVQVEGSGLARKSGKNRLDALSGVFGYAVDLEILEANPVDSVRAILRRRGRTKGGRAASDPTRNVRPLDAAELGKFLASSAELAQEAREKAQQERQEGKKARHRVALDGHLLDVLLTDAGLRLGEALGLRWGDVWLGRDPSDTTRAITVRETLARGRHVGVPKSGRERSVALSRRLRSALLERFLAAGRPSDDERILPMLDQSNYRKRHFNVVCKRAKIGTRRPKDLRDTYASQLLTVGVQLGYVSQQLGHSDVAVTARHYARWAGGNVYTPPLALELGDVPADLLHRTSEGSRVRAGSAEG